jgi:branched-chain amino acid transport system permease protein
MNPATFVQLVFDGIAIGLVYVFMAAGFNLMLSVTNVFFIAFGMFYALGAYFTWAFMQIGVQFFPAVIIATILCGIGGAIVHELVMARVNRGEQALSKALIASIMLFTVFYQLVLLAFGTSARGLNPVITGEWKIAGVVIAIDRAVMIIISVCVLVALHFFLRRSKIGRGARALAVNRDVASLYGVNSGRMATVIFGVGLGLAAFAGGLLAPLFGIDVSMGSAGFVVLLVIMLGGIGSMLGSIVSGVILGLIISFAQFFVSAGVGQIIFFGIVALFFIVKPGGLFGVPMEDPPGEVGFLVGAKMKLKGIPKWVGVAVALAVMIALPLVVKSPYYIHLMILISIYAVLGMATTLGLRAGMINVAAAAFWGIGAYSTALMTTKLGWNFWVALPATLLITLVLATLLGIVVCRFAGALGMMFCIVFASLIPLVFQTFKFFGRSMGISAIPAVGSIGPINFGSINSYYYLVLAFSIISVILVLLFTKGWTGRAWLGLASSPKLGQAVGIDPFSYRLINFIVMSIIPALLGTVYACYLGSVQPTMFEIFVGIDFLVIAFIGGLSYLVVGSVAGAIIMVMLPELLRVSKNYEPIITAAVVILIIMFLPRGVLGSADRLKWSGLARLFGGGRGGGGLAPQSAEANKTVEMTVSEEERA